MTVATLEGSRVTDITSFYDEVNRVLMRNETWQLGESLDALNDLLYGGFGLMAHRDEAGDSLTVIWRDHHVSREALGFEATRAWYEQKLARPGTFDVSGIQRRLDDLLAGTGPTYFELVLEVFADHPDITLDLA